MPWTRRHLLTIEQLSREEIEQIHATAAAFKRILGRSVKKVPALRGKTIVNLVGDMKNGGRTPGAGAAADRAASSLARCASDAADTGKSSISADTGCGTMPSSTSSVPITSLKTRPAERSGAPSFSA